MIHVEAVIGTVQNDLMKNRQNAVRKTAAALVSVSDVTKPHSPIMLA